MVRGNFLFITYKRKNFKYKRKSRNRNIGNQSQITEFSGEIVNKSTTLVSISKEVFRIGNTVNIEYFCDLIKLFRLSASVIRFFTDLKVH